MKLTDLSEIKSLMDRHSVTFKKKYGQNFLISPTIPERIADAAVSGMPEGARGILEIGPGIGTLTQPLAERADKVVALEIDESLIPILGETLANFNNVKIINQDVMKTDLAELRETEFGSEFKLSVAANLPYYITTPILMKLIESGISFESITVMVQKEVASRLCAAPGTPDYGAITAVLAYYGRCERLFTVSSGCFVPAPKVDSAVVRLNLYKTPEISVADSNELFRVIRGAFAQRRKTLSNSLLTEYSALGRDIVNDAIRSSGYEPSVRGEALSCADFARIADYFTAIKAEKSENK
ncbi:MAG TPA: 16S rRNA (adenine(1518)-N(6)/adenine(1519)-N(6))-dimethyltransferase RsmA [Firmicutes bacterium]|nr:16S rRNA (adenine(1518)-N(6)/adenine(1519)-N(6))-dimethyltransferase RsmA [Bacillota bacterium]